MGPNPGGDNTKEVKVMSPIPGMALDEFAELCQSVFICVPYRQGEGIGSTIAESIGAWGRWGMTVMLLKDPHGGFIELVRSSMCSTFLEHTRDHPKIKYLIMIDNDQTINELTPLLLARHELPIVSGVVCSYNDKRGIFACFTVEDDNGISRFPTLQYTKKMPASGLVRAKQVGAGLLCVRRDVLETVIANGDVPFRIPERLRDESFKLGDLKKGEDIVFSDQCEKYGFDRYVDLSVHAGHWKNLNIGWPADHIDENLSVKDWAVSIFDQGVLENENARE